MVTRVKVTWEPQLRENLISPSQANSSAQSTSTQRIEAGTIFSFLNYIGKFIGNATFVTDRNDLLHSWTPVSYSFPSFRFGQQHRSFQNHWLKECKWLVQYLNFR